MSCPSCRGAACSHILRLALVAVLVTMFVGCASGRRGGVTYHDDKMDFSLVQTVAVLPFANLTTNQTAADRVRDAFTTMLQATGSVYVQPPGEVGRAVGRARLANPTQPTAEEVVALGRELKADVVFTGTLREYGEVRSGNATSNVIALSLQMIETQTGKVVWSAASTKGGISAGDRLFGGGGEAMNDVTEKAIRDLLDKLYD